MTMVPVLDNWPMGRLIVLRNARWPAGALLVGEVTSLVQIQYELEMVSEEPEVGGVLGVIHGGLFALPNTTAESQPASLYPGAWKPGVGPLARQVLSVTMVSVVVSVYVTWMAL